MLNLTIQHFIHLTKAQRYALHDGIQLVVVGISVPVWFLNKNTSEPAKEVFCQYYLQNTREDQPINIVQDGYEITLPYRQGQELLNEHGHRLSDEEWRKLNFAEPDKLEALYDKHVSEISSEQLLDPPTGRRCMTYREHNKVKHGDGDLIIIHYVNIMDIDQLMSTLV